MEMPLFCVFKVWRKKRKKNKKEREKLASFLLIHPQGPLILKKRT